MPPPKDMLLDQLDDRGVFVYSVGKIFDVFLGRGIRDQAKTKNNADGMAKTLEAMDEIGRGPDFRQSGRFRPAVRPSQRCGRIRRRARTVRRVAARVRAPRSAKTTSRSSPPTMAATRAARAPTTAANTCRCWPAARDVKRGVDLGVRASLSDIGQTVAANFGAKLAHGASFLPQIL